MRALDYDLTRTRYQDYVVLWAIVCIMAGLTLRDTAQWLTDAGVTTWRGHKFNKWSLSQLLREAGLSVGAIRS